MNAVSVISAPMHALERYAVEAPALVSATDTTPARMRGLACPYGIGNKRPGVMWKLADGDDWPTAEPYDETIFEPGVFADWLAENAGRVRFLFQHGDADWSGSPSGLLSLPIGTLPLLAESAAGLEVEAEFAAHPLAQWVRELVQAGALNEMSIAFGITEADIRVGSDGRPRRHATRGELYDASVVVWGQYGKDAPIYQHAGIEFDPATFYQAEADRAKSAALGMAYAANALREQHAGAAISQANAAILTAAADSIREAVDALTPHAEALDELVSSGSRASEPTDTGTDEEAARWVRGEERLASLRAYAADA